MTGPLDTSLGGDARGFPSTHWSLLRDARNRDAPAYRQALEDLCRRYWKPAYCFARATRDLSNEEAKDAVQEFFAELIEGDFFARFSPERGSFRAYLKGALTLFLLERRRKAGAQKRGGTRKILGLEDSDFTRAEAEARREGESPEAAFDRQWAMDAIDHALRDLEEEYGRSNRDSWFAVFRRYEWGTPGTYADLAREFGIAESEVGSALAHARRRFRELFLDRIRAYTDSEGEAATELAWILSLLGR